MLRSLMVLLLVLSVPPVVPQVMGVGMKMGVGVMVLLVRGPRGGGSARAVRYRRR